MYMEEDVEAANVRDSWTKNVLVISVYVSCEQITVVRGAICSDGMYDFFLEQLGP
jgi:hypothetical protein